MKQATKLIGLFTAFIMYCVSAVCQANVIHVLPNTIISHSTTYKNVSLDMERGSFIVKNKAVLTIESSIVHGKLSKKNPLLINIDDGSVVLKDNHFFIKTADIAPHPKTQSLHWVMQLALGSVNIDSNYFTIDKHFTAGLFITTSSIATTGLKITNNRFEKFHGVLYLINSDNDVIADNVFSKNSYGHIVVVGNDDKIMHNTIAFAGNNLLGNSIDIMNSNNIEIRNNMLLTPTCHGIYVLNSRNLLIDSNRIAGGITYAMNILSYPETAKVDPYLKDLVSTQKMKMMLSHNITVTNNFMSQNRFGIAASDVDGLTIKNNHFIQRFQNNEARKFWTDNTILLTHVTHLNWENNIYKEAFTQENLGDNSKSFQFVTFPISGGISL